MIARYTLHENELNETFYEQIKQQFKNKRISITIEEVIDETEYLLASPSNVQHLLEAIENTKTANSLFQINIEDLKNGF